MIASGPEQLMPTIIFHFIWCKGLSRTVLEKLNLLLGLLEISVGWSQAVVWLSNFIWPNNYMVLKCQMFAYAWEAFSVVLLTN